MEIEPLNQISDFPEIDCPIHQFKIVLVCPILDCKERTFLCPQCINSDIKHLNDHSPFLTIQEFAQFLAKHVELCHEDIDDSIAPLIQSEQRHLKEFAEKMEKQKQAVQTTMSSLNHLYEEKCSELVKQLKEKFEQQQKIFNGTFRKFREEFQADKEANANLPKFLELKKRVSQMSNPVEIQSYLRDVFCRKQNWEHASDSIKTMGRRAELEYKNRIQQLQDEPPKFMNPDQVITGWCIGLNGLIDSLSNNENIFENMVTRSAEVQVEMTNIKELQLLTPKMIKEDTVISLIMSEITLDMDDAQQINNGLNSLSNLERLQFEFSQTKASNDVWNLILSSLQSLKDLKKLQLLAGGSSFSDRILQSLNSNLSNSNSIEELNLDLSYNGIGDTGCSELGILLQNQTNLKILNLQLQANDIHSKGVEHLSNGIKNLHCLESLTINLGGFLLHHNRIRDEGVTHIAQAMKNLKLLNHLNLDIGYNEISDSSLLELTYSLRELPRITTINLDLYQNLIRSKATLKLGKYLGKSQIKDLQINLQSNEIQDEGVKDLLFGLNKAQQLSNLIMNLRNCSLSKKVKNSLRNDIQQGKCGKEYLVMNVLF